MPSTDSHLAADDRPAPPLLRNLNFQIMWFSTAAAGFGDRMIELVAMPMLGVGGESAQSSSINAAIYFWFFLPWVIITPIGGWLADTLPRKWIMLGCDEGRAALLLLAAILVPAGITAEGFSHIPVRELHEAWKVYSILAGVGLFAAIFGPTRNAMIPQIVPPSQLNPANSVILGIGVIASLIGYAIGGKLIEVYSVRTGIIVALLCYAITGTFWGFIVPRPHTGMELDKELGEWTRMARAVQYIRRHGVVVRLVLLNALLWSIAMIVALVIAALCKHAYLITESYMKWFAMMSATLGAGMLLSAGFVTWINVRREADFVLLAMIAATAVFLALLAFNRSYSVGLVLILGIGFRGGVVMILVSSITQLVTPNYILGRVGGIREVVSNALTVLVTLLVWRLPVLREVRPNLPEADWILIWSLYVLAAVMLGVVVYGMWRVILRGPMPTPMVNLFWRFDRVYTLIWHRARWVGRHHIPATGPVILASNHTTGLDPFLIQAAVPRMVRWVMLRSYQYRFMNFLWKRIDTIAIDQNGGDVSQVRETLRAARERRGRRRSSSLKEWIAAGAAGVAAVPAGDRDAGGAERGDDRAGVDRGDDAAAQHVLALRQAEPVHRDVWKTVQARSEDGLPVDRG